jgi:chemotaxis protein MotB
MKTQFYKQKINRAGSRWLEHRAKQSKIRTRQMADYGALSNKMEVLQESYIGEKNSNEALQSNMSKNRDLLSQLGAKGKALAIEQERLSKSAQGCKWNH